MSHEHKHAEHEQKPEYPVTEPLNDPQAKGKWWARSKREGQEPGRAGRIARTLSLGNIRGETRAGIAIMLSFLVLVAVFLVNRGRKPGSSGSASASKVVAWALPAAPKPDPKAKPASSASSTRPANPTPTAAIAQQTQADGQGAPAATVARADGLPPVPIAPDALPKAEAGGSFPSDSSLFPPPPSFADATTAPPETLAATPVPNPAFGGLPPATEPEPTPTMALTPPTPVGGSKTVTTGAGTELAGAGTVTPPLPAAAGSARGGYGARVEDAAAPAPAPDRPRRTPVASRPAPSETAVAGLPTSSPVDARSSAPAAASEAPPPGVLPRDLGVSIAARRGTEDLIPIPNVSREAILSDAPAATAAPVLAMTAPRATAKNAAKARPVRADQAGDLDHIEPVTHRVQRGENFWTISKDYYGSGRYYKALWSANRDRVSAPDQLTVGQTIVVPPPESLDRALVEPPAAPGSARSASKNSESRQPGLLSAGARRRTPSEVELALPVAGQTASRSSTSPDRAADYSVSNAEPTYPKYRVGPRDTLRSIARDTLGDAHRSDEILELNRDQIDDPRRLTPGIMLVLPDDARVGRRLR
jgi:nucleoid-associated protein YgaU